MRCGREGRPAGQGDGRCGLEAALSVGLRDRPGVGDERGARREQICRVDNVRAGVVVSIYPTNTA